jgi:hypothetical protein
MGSNNSYWGDIESSEDLDLATLDEVVLTDHGFTLSGFIDKVQDAVFDALYSSDSTPNDINSISEDANESSLKSISSIISDRQTLPSPDNTNEN